MVWAEYSLFESLDPLGVGVLIVKALYWASGSRHLPGMISCPTMELRSTKLRWGLWERIHGCPMAP